MLTCRVHLNMTSGTLQTDRIFSLTKQVPVIVSSGWRVDGGLTKRRVKIRVRLQRFDRRADVESRRRQVTSVTFRRMIHEPTKMVNRRIGRHITIHCDHRSTWHQYGSTLRPSTNRGIWMIERLNDYQNDHTCENACLFEWDSHWIRKKSESLRVLPSELVASHW